MLEKEMKKQDTCFQEIKVQMVMKLKKLGRRAAIAEIASMDAVKRKAVEEEVAREATRRSGKILSVPVDCDDELMTAEEFFGQID